MIDTALIKVIILTLNLIFYSSGSETAQTDMLQAGKYAGTLSYTTKDRTMTVYYGKGSPSRKMLTVKTIDNGLYSVKMDREPPFEVDLAEYFMKIDWKKFPPMNSRKIGEVNLGSSGKNFYLNYKSYTFITDRKLLQKKKKKRTKQ